MTARQTFEMLLGAAILLFGLVGIIWFVYDLASGPSEDSNVASQPAIAAAADAKQKVDEALVKAQAEAPNYSSPVSGLEYKSVLGRLWIGTALYNKGTHSPFGFVVEADWENVWVADSYSPGRNNLSLYARKYPRKFITDNFETK